MRTPINLVLGSLCALALVAPADEPEAAAETASEILLPFKKSLKQALVKGMESGPMEAMDVCRIKAPKLAAQAARPGVTLGRTSHKLRNPSNAPADWMKPLLKAYRAADGKQPARTVQLTDGKTGYVEPIYAQTLCLTCHGTNLAPPVQEHLASRYPNDQATGFSDGDFRGRFWVVLDPP